MACRAQQQNLEVSLFGVFEFGLCCDRSIRVVITGDFVDGFFCEPTIKNWNCEATQFVYDNAGVL